MKRADAWARLRAYPETSEHRVVGLMSGTSADGIDAALVRFRGHDLDATHELLAFRETPFEPALRSEILEVAAVESLPLERLMRLEAALGERYAAATLELLAGAGMDPSRVDAIGMHGQTVRHVPRAESAGEALTLQVGSAPILAERTGIAVVSDFRRRDTAAGGEGAPLVPLTDWWLFRSERESRALLNLGGMANLTHLERAAPVDRLVAFDTGPGNAILDALVRIGSRGERHFDPGGEAAARGTASEPLLAELLADPFFDLPPPRSTGRERFGQRYAERLLEVGLAMGLREDDVLATAVELTAASVARSIEEFLLPRGGVDAVFLSGGGARNETLVRALERRLRPARVEPLERLGVPAEAKEALAFAFLAHQTLCGRPGNVPGATGARHAVVLGSITPGVLG